MNNVGNQFATIMLKIVGTKCNMRCLYCYEHVSKQMVDNYNVTIGQIKRYLSNFLAYERVFIVFHGGEPLLADKGLIKNILEYIFSNFNKNCKVQIQTNGTLIDEEWMSIFEKYSDNLSISLSLDPKGEKDLRILPNLDYRSILINKISIIKKIIDNIGVIAVANSKNKNSFIEFIEELIQLGVHSLTINKCQDNGENLYSITEREYVELLKEISLCWINRKWYEKINIQPLISLFSNNKNKLCIYLADEEKCYSFKTFYAEGQEQEYCDHIQNIDDKKLYHKCLSCKIYRKCGGGCLVEKKDDDFCQARKELFSFLERIKYGNKRIEHK